MEKECSIKIFVSHRIDQDSKVVDNDLYVPVRCGAVFDKRKNVAMLGDNTGENISSKRDLYGELTVIYWAWKNQKADYYGLHHYRRYFSFLDYDLPTELHRHAPITNMANWVLDELGLLNKDKLYKEITSADIIAPYEYDMSDIILKNDCATMREYWIKDTPNYMKEQDFDTMLTLIHQLAPEYEKSAKEYMNTQTFMGFNICIMKKEYFFKCCEFMFPILFEFEKIRIKENDESVMRWCGYMGEWLFSIFIYHMKKNPNCKVIHKQVIRFLNTDRCQLPIANDKGLSDQRSLYILSHPIYFKLKKLRYRLLKHITFGKKRKRYREKYRALKKQMKEARRMAKKLRHM